MASDKKQSARRSLTAPVAGMRTGLRGPAQAPNRLRSRLAALVGIAFAVAFGSVEGRLYRWVDDTGAVQYTDRVPPSQVEKGHTELNDQGLRVDTVPPAQSKEEVERERALERLRAEQERLVEQQKAADRALLRSFRSVDDLIMTRDGKVAAVDVVIGVARGKVRQQQQRLQNLQTEAANLERAGKPVPQHLADGIEKTERSIRETYATIVEREQQKEKIRQDFDRVLKRFRQLRDIPEDGAASDQGEGRPDLRNLLICEGESECALLWTRAVRYVKEHATTPVQTLGSNILITAPPQTPDDLSLTLSLTRDKDSESSSLFLDMRCKSEGAVEADCKDERALSVLDGFRNAVLGTPGEGPAGPALDRP